MANIIIDDNFTTVAASHITIKGTTNAYEASNVMDFIHLKRRWRMSDATKSDSFPIMRFLLDSASATHAALVLDDVNFDKVMVFGNSSDMGTDWSGASYVSSVITISKDDQVNRYKAYIPLTNFGYAYGAIGVPTTASPVGTATGNWEIGRVLWMKTANAFTQNMGRDYKRGAEQPFNENAVGDRETTGPVQWVGTLAFSYRTQAQEADLTTLNNKDISNTLVFYENNGDTSKVYVCLRDNSYVGTYYGGNSVKGSSIKLKERV